MKNRTIRELWCLEKCSDKTGNDEFDGWHWDIVRSRKMPVWFFDSHTKNYYFDGNIWNDFAVVVNKNEENKMMKQHNDSADYNNNCVMNIVKREKNSKWLRIFNDSNF